METVQNLSGVMWYNYAPSDGLGSTPVQVELGGDIVRQINSQVHLQYGNLHPIPVTTSAQLQQQQHHQIIVQHSGPEPSDLIVVAAPKQPRVRSRLTNGERVPCGECGKTFSCNANLRDHLRLHTGERPFDCTECGMSFAQRSNWRLHKRVHTGERPYMCGICGKTFSRSSHLPGHMRVHTGERPYQCHVCEHLFASQQALKNHSRTHTGDKPFVCDYCETAFTHSSSLSSHKKRCTGTKRKRGRPLGTGRVYKRKVMTGSSGVTVLSPARLRGRPRKRGKGRRGGRKASKKTITDIGEFVLVKQEVPDENGEDEEDLVGDILAATKDEQGDEDTIVMDVDQSVPNDDKGRCQHRISVMHVVADETTPNSVTVDLHLHDESDQLPLTSACVTTEEGGSATPTMMVASDEVEMSNGDSAVQAQETQTSLEAESQGMDLVVGDDDFVAVDSDVGQVWMVKPGNY